MSDYGYPTHQSLWQLVDSIMQANVQMKRACVCKFYLDNEVVTLINADGR